MKLLDLDSKPNQFIEDLNMPGTAKKYVRVLGDFYLTYDNKSERIKGLVRPVMLIHTDGRQFLIDQVSDPVTCASIKSGGIGLRYTCRIRSSFLYLYLDDNKWFYEKVSESAGVPTVKPTNDSM